MGNRIDTVLKCVQTVLLPQTPDRKCQIIGHRQLSIRHFTPPPFKKLNYLKLMYIINKCKTILSAILICKYKFMAWNHVEWCAK